jgi:hypothetical protein
MGAMPALVGDDHPLGQMLLEGGERREAEIRERIPLDEFHARFGFALGPRAVWRARAGLHIPIATERHPLLTKIDRQLLARLRFHSDRRPAPPPDSGPSGGHDDLRLVPSSICQIFTRRNCQIFNRR